jgi:hypothetical protein
VGFILGDILIRGTMIDNPVKLERIVPSVVSIRTYAASG